MGNSQFAILLVVIIYSGKNLLDAKATTGDLWRDQGFCAVLRGLPHRLLTDVQGKKGTFAIGGI